MSFADFESQFGAQYETFYFYGGQVELKFDKIKHEYFRVADDGSLIPLISASKVGQIIDKSQALMPWACKQMSQKIFREIPITITKSGAEAVIMERSAFEKTIMASKNAHKEKLEDAGNVGAAAHNWIEGLINYELAGQGAPYIPLPSEERVKNCCQAATSWMHRHNVRWISTEQKVFSKEYDIPGTEDGKAWTDSCGDIKCCPETFKNRLSLVDWKSSNALHAEYVLQISLYWHAELEEHNTPFSDAWIIRLGKEDAEFEPWHLDQDIISRGWDAFRDALALTRSLDRLEVLQKAERDRISVIKKEEAAVAREEKRRIACPYSARFKGSKYPSCGPCETCLKIYVDKQVDKLLGWVWKELPYRLLTAGEPNAETAVVDVVPAIDSKPSAFFRQLVDSLPA